MNFHDAYWNHKRNRRTRLLDAECQAQQLFPSIRLNRVIWSIVNCARIREDGEPNTFLHWSDFALASLLYAPLWNGLISETEIESHFGTHVTTLANALIQRPDEDTTHRILRLSKWATGKLNRMALLIERGALTYSIYGRFTDSIKYHTEIVELHNYIEIVDEAIAREFVEAFNWGNYPKEQGWKVI